MFNKKSSLFIVVLLTFTMLFVACDEDDEALIKESLDTFIEGIQLGDADKIESVLAEEVYDAYYGETISRAELAAELSRVKDDITMFSVDGVEVVVEMDNIALEDFTDDTVMVVADIYLGTITPTEAIIQELEQLQTFYEIEEIDQAIEALEGEDFDAAKEYLASSDMFSDDDAEFFISNELGESEEVEIGLIKEDDNWYINLLDE